jgi:arylsulfatase A-like enzyme
MFQQQTYEVPRTFNKPDANLPSWGKPNGKFNGMGGYYGMVKCIDDNVGKILDALRSCGLMDETIIVFTADHGDLRGEHHRQNKGVPYEGSARIPFIMYYPAKIKPGTVVNEALGCVDFLPTILSLMGCRTAGQEQGRDASALFVNGEAPSGWTDVAFLRGTGDENGWLAAVTDRYKLVYSTQDEPWLFDLEKDPDELLNCFRDPSCRETIRELSQQIIEYGSKYGDARTQNSKIKADLTWAVKGTGEYVPTAPEGPAAKSGSARKNKARRQGRKRSQ